MLLDDYFDYHFFHFKRCDYRAFITVIIKLDKDYLLVQRVHVYHNV